MNQASTQQRPRRVLILGANGRFGLAAAQAFDAAGWEVMAQVRRAPADGMPARARIVALPTCDIDGIVAHAAGADVVVHAINPKDYTLWFQLKPYIEIKLVATPLHKCFITNILSFN